MTWVTVYRADRQLRGKELSANTLASFLVAQGCRSLPDLSTTWVMDEDVLAFLNRSTAIDYWRRNGWLLPRGGGRVLTDKGLDSILDREAGEARTASGKRNAVNVSPELVRAARLFILTGERRPSDKDAGIPSHRFDLDVPGGEWTVG
jgi:hypothetical protein